MSSSDPAKALHIKALSQRRGSRWLFDGLNATVPNGTALVLTGPNGSGKTTLLRTIAGFLAPVSGTVTLTGYGDEASIAQNAHFVGHLNALKPAVTVEDNLTFWTRMLAIETQPDPGPTVHHALERLGIAHLTDIPAGYLSAGQQRRLALGRLLAAPRPIWLLDEPTAALDAAGSELVKTLIDDHTASGGMVVVSTHLPMPLERGAGLDFTVLAGPLAKSNKTAPEPFVGLL